MKLHVCKFCERSYLCFGRDDMGLSETGGLVLHVPREAPPVAGLGICPDCEFELEEQDDYLDLESLN